LAYRRWLDANGVGLVDENAKAEDHIGHMLVLMHWLSETRPELLPEFLCLHFLSWAPHFLELLEQRARHPFYQGLAGLTLASLAGIQKQLDLTVTYPHFYR
jgi:TorA maturation chaperone TorD